MSCTVSVQGSNCYHCGPCSILNTMEYPPRYPPARMWIDQIGLRCQRWTMVEDMRERTCFDQVVQIRNSWPVARAAILRTCKKMYSEAKDVLYNETLFLVHVQVASTPTLNTRSLDKSWTLPMRITLANHFAHIRHVHLSLNVWSHLDITYMISMLSDLLNKLPPLEELESANASLVFELERPMSDGLLRPVSWEWFVQLFARLPLKNELRMFFWPDWLDEETMEHGRLNETVGGKLVLKGDNERFCFLVD